MSQIRHHPGPLWVPGLLAAVGLILLSQAFFFDTGEPATSIGRSSVSEGHLRGKAQSWLGTPHRIGGRNHGGVDCSGLTLELLEPLGAKLPRRAEEMREEGRSVSLDRVRPGDLLFFDTDRHDGLRGHVGVYLGKGEFVHATSSKGVIISAMDSPYWGPRIIEARRVLR